MPTHAPPRRALTPLLAVGAMLIALLTVVMGPAPQAVALSTVDQFVADHRGGTWANVQGSYSGECVSLVSQYLRKVHGVDTGAWGNAVDYRAGGSGGNQLGSRGFSWSTGQDFQNGDILVWGSGSATSSVGHIAIWYNGKIFQQNWAGNRSAQLGNFFASGFLGKWRKAPPVQPPTGFDRAPDPTVNGTPWVGLQLSAAPGSWSPSANFRYQWLRSGAPIGGATSPTYTVHPSDTGHRLSVTVTGEASGRTTTSRTSAGTMLVAGLDTNGNGLDDTQDLLPWDSDVNADGRPDLVGFAEGGTRVALNTGRGFAAPASWTSSYGAAQTSGSWTWRTPRTLVDVNADGRPDVVGFGNRGVSVSLNSGSSFGPAKDWTSGFSPASGWEVPRHPRTVIDVNNDGLPDLVGFGEDGVWVAIGTGTSFEASRLWVKDFGAGNSGGGWRPALHPRTVVDVNRDGRPDIVGFANAGVVVALNTGSSFSQPKLWIANFGVGAGGWDGAYHPRVVEDVNADGLPDIVGFANAGTLVALNTGTSFAPAQLWSNSFGAGPAAGGWRVADHPRRVIDVNGDGRPDVVGFGKDGTVVALNTGTKFAPPTVWLRDLTPEAGGWAVSRHPRSLADVNADGRLDLVGFAEYSTVVSLNTGSSFARPATWSPTFAAHPSAGGWTVPFHPRGVSSRSVLPGAPTIRGTARTGLTLTVATGGWKPSTTALSRQWFRDGQPIPGAVGSSLRLTPADVGRRITVRVAGRSAGYTRVSRTSASVTPTPGLLTVRGRVALTGKARKGRLLRVRLPHSSPAASHVSYRWLRNGRPIPRATRATFRCRPKDRGARIKVVVTVRRDGYLPATSRSRAVRVR